VVLDALFDALSAKEKPPLFHDLDELTGGSWEKDEAFEQVDGELWK
jgi:hypothetical protein